MHRAAHSHPLDTMVYVHNLNSKRLHRLTALPRSLLSPRMCEQPQGSFRQRPRHSYFRCLRRLGKLAHVVSGLLWLGDVFTLSACSFSGWRRDCIRMFCSGLAATLEEVESWAVEAVLRTFCRAGCKAAIDRGMCARKPTTHFSATIDAHPSPRLMPCVHPRRQGAIRQPTHHRGTGGVRWLSISRHAVSAGVEEVSRCG